MSARILVVDDLEPNVKLLSAKLSAEYFDVLSAMNGEDALRIASDERPDVILLDVMMPGMDGFEICRRLKADPVTTHIPVVMVTALDQQSDRVTGLEAGADDFLSKPVDDFALFARVKNLARLKMMTDELRLRDETGAEFGLEGYRGKPDVSTAGSRIFVIDDNPSTGDKIARCAGDQHEVVVDSDPSSALERARTEKFDLFVVSFSIEGVEGLRLVSQIRSIETLRQKPIIAIMPTDDTKQLIRALELGVTDYFVRPIDDNEAKARLRTQLHRNRYTEMLRQSFQQSFELAVTDQLTGLYNRRYLGNHLRALCDKAQDANRPITVMLLDIDHFKQINDQYGHDAGDLILKEFSRRIVENVRGIDLVCRYGGEEFVIVMPDTDHLFAQMAAERLRQDIAANPMPISNGVAVPVTVSIGLAVAGADDHKSPQELIKQADIALYSAKDGGRNRVVAPAA